MDSADWRALAARFEAATDETIYECVLRLVEAVPHPERGRLIVAINGAKNARLPDLLLGVVVACVPEGGRYRITSEYVAAVAPLPGGGRVTAYSERLDLIPAALGAAVCRAWAEVAGGKEVG